MDTLLASLTVSVTELERHYSDILEQADEGPVAALNHNRPEAYLLPATHYERLINHLEDLGEAQVVKERAGGPFVDVRLDEL